MEEVRTRKVKGAEKKRKREQESQQVIGIEEVVAKIVDKNLDKVMGFMEKFMEKVEKGTVTKDN